MRRPARARQSEQAVMFRELFLQEEFRGDRLVNTVRFFILFILLALAAFKAGFPAHLRADTAFLATVGIIVVGYLYTIAGFLLYRRSIYHPALKYASMTLDVTLAVLSVAVYKLEPYAEYGQIYVLARASIIFWFVIWSLLRYNVWLSVYAGVLGGIEYLLFVVLGNDMTGMTFSFTAKDGLTYTSEFASAEALLKVVYLLIAGGLAAVVAWRLRALVINSITREHEKGELLAQNQVVETVNRENRKYLDNISQGLLLMTAST